jgi:hypothetical protein
MKFLLDCGHCVTFGHFLGNDVTIYNWKLKSSVRSADIKERSRDMCDDIFNDFNGLDWEDWMIIGPMSEDIAEEEREKDKAYRDTFGDDYMDSGTEW